MPNQKKRSNVGCRGILKDVALGGAAAIAAPIAMAQAHSATDAPAMVRDFTKWDDT